MIYDGSTGQGYLTHNRISNFCAEKYMTGTNVNIIFRLKQKPQFQNIKIKI